MRERHPAFAGHRKFNRDLGRAQTAVSWVGLCFGSPEVADGEVEVWQKRKIKREASAEQ